MALPYRPLGTVKQILEELGIDITYAYEDLVFIQHNPVLLQFGEVGEMLFLYANVDAEPDVAEQLFAAIQVKAVANGMTLVRRGKYRINEGEENNISIEFIEEPES